MVPTLEAALKHTQKETPSKLISVLGKINPMSTYIKTYKVTENNDYNTDRGHLEGHSRQYFIIDHTHTELSRIITRRLHSLVMVGVDADFILLQVEGVLAGVNCP